MLVNKTGPKRRGNGLKRAKRPEKKRLFQDYVYVFCKFHSFAFLVVRSAVNLLKILMEGLCQCFTGHGAFPPILLAAARQCNNDVVLIALLGHINCTACKLDSATSCQSSLKSD